MKESVEVYLTELNDLVFLLCADFNGNHVYTTAASVNIDQSTNVIDDVEMAFDKIAWDTNEDQFTRYGIKETDAMVRNFIPNAGNPLGVAYLDSNMKVIKTRLNSYQWHNYFSKEKNNG